MPRRLLAPISHDLPTVLHPLRPGHRVTVLVIVFVVYLGLTAAGHTPAIALGVVAALGIAAGRIVSMLDRDDRAAGWARI